MAVVSEQLIRGYAAVIERAQRNAGSRARSLVSRWIGSHPDAGAEDVRNASIEILGAVADEYGNAAASAACDLYDGTMLLEGVDLPAAEPAEADRAGIERAVRYQLRKYLDGDMEGYLKAIADAAQYHVRRQASMTTIRNCERDNRRVLRGGLGTTQGNQRYGALHQPTAESGFKRPTRRSRRRYAGGALQPGDIAYARVPTGAETCTYCMMLASRGFAYRSEESAGHADHRGCNCLIVAGVHGSTTVEGVDLAEQYDTWKEMATADARHDRGELTEQKRAVVDSHPGATANLEAAGARKAETDTMGPRAWYVPKEYKGYERDGQTASVTYLGARKVAVPAGGPMVEIGVVDIKDDDAVDAVANWARETFRDEPVEHATVIQSDGHVYHSIGDVSAVSLEGASLSGAIVIHNHPPQDGEQVSLSSVDFDKMQECPDMARLEANTHDFDCVAVPNESIRNVTYNYAYLHAAGPKRDEFDETNHQVMEWLDAAGFLSYTRTRVQRDS